MPGWCQWLGISDGMSGRDLLQSPVSAAELAKAERKLGFRLHPLLATLYRKVGNGGFGPADSVLPLSGGPEAD